MAVTFNPSLVSERDRVRFALGEVSSDSLIQDETLDSLINSASSLQHAAAQGARFIATQYAKRAAESAAGEQRVKYGDREKFFMSLAADLLAGIVPIPGAALVPTAAMGEIVQPDLTNYRP